MPAIPKAPILAVCVRVGVCVLTVITLWQARALRRYVVKTWVQKNIVDLVHLVWVPEPSRKTRSNTATSRSQTSSQLAPRRRH